MTNLQLIQLNSPTPPTENLLDNDNDNNNS